MSPMWESEGEARSEDKSVSANDSRESSVCNEALHEDLYLFLEEWELAKVALSCHMALGMLCQERHKTW